MPLPSRAQHERTGGAGSAVFAWTSEHVTDMFEGYSGATRVLFIVGDPIAQVKSPLGVTESLRERRADAIVVPAHVKPADIDAFFALAERMPNVDGIIVTVPHKFDAARLCAHVTPRARSIGAANVVRRAAGDLRLQRRQAIEEAAF